MIQFFLSWFVVAVTILGFLVYFCDHKTTDNFIRNGHSSVAFTFLFLLASVPVSFVGFILSIIWSF